MLDIFVFTVESRSIMIIIYTWYIICIAIPNSLHIWYIYRYFEHLSTRPSQWFHLVQVKILALLPQMLTKDGKLMVFADPHWISWGLALGTRRSISKSTRSTWLFPSSAFQKRCGTDRCESRESEIHTYRKGSVFNIWRICVRFRRIQLLWGRETTQSRMTFAVSMLRYTPCLKRWALLSDDASLITACNTEWFILWCNVLGKLGDIARM